MLSPMNEPSNEVDPRVIRRKVWWRTVPLIFVLYIVAYLDRANLGFAKLQMCDALGLSPEVYGWGAGIFFVGYLILEIPGAMLVERWSARKWFARILITWGICSMGMALVHNAWQFYTARALLGLAEAGFFPGVIVYFSHWFPRAERARALAGMVLGIPVSLALGARVSGHLLEVHWLGLAGWQWVFIVEGLPAVLFGCAVPFLLTDRPRNAKWLTPAEADWLEQKLERERQEAAAISGATLGDALKRPMVWLLALGIFAANTGGYALVFWLPTAVKNMLLRTHEAVTDIDVMNWLLPVYLLGIVGVWLSGQSSDRFHERKWHCAAGMALTGVFLAISVIAGQSWNLVFFWLCLVGFFAFSWPSPFWALPTQTLPPAAAAVAIGFINMCANIAGLIGSPIVGTMEKHGFSQAARLQFLAGCYVVGGIIIAMLRIRTSAKEKFDIGSN